MIVNTDPLTRNSSDSSTGEKNSTCSFQEALLACREFFRKNRVIDVDGNVVVQGGLKNPRVEDFSNIHAFLQKERTFTVKSSGAVIKFTLKELFKHLKSKHSEIEKIELYGSGVLYLLGKDWLCKQFDLPMPESIFESLHTITPRDFDFRLHVAGVGREKLLDLTHEVVLFFANKLNPNDLRDSIEKIRGKGKLIPSSLSNFHCPKNQKDRFSLISFSDIDLEFAAHLQRDHLFECDHIRLNVESGEVVGNPCQAIIDRLCRFLHLNMIETVNGKGWARALLKLAQGYTWGGKDQMKDLLMRSEPPVAMVKKLCVEHFPNEKDKMEAVAHHAALSLCDVREAKKLFGGGFFKWMLQLLTHSENLEIGLHYWNDLKKSGAEIELARQVIETLVTHHPLRGIQELVDFMKAGAFKKQDRLEVSSKIIPFVQKGYLTSLKVPLEVLMTICRHGKKNKRELVKKALLCLKDGFLNVERGAEALELLNCGLNTGWLTDPSVLVPTYSRLIEKNWTSSLRQEINQSKIEGSQKAKLLIEWLKRSDHQLSVFTKLPKKTVLFLLSFQKEDLVLFYKQLLKKNNIIGPKEWNALVFLQQKLKEKGAEEFLAKFNKSYRENPEIKGQYYHYIDEIFSVGHPNAIQWIEEAYLEKKKPKGLCKTLIKHTSELLPLLEQAKRLELALFLFGLNPDASLKGHEWAIDEALKQKKHLGSLNKILSKREGVDEYLLKLIAIRLHEDKKCAALHLSSRLDNGQDLKWILQNSTIFNAIQWIESEAKEQIWKNILLDNRLFIKQLPLFTQHTEWNDEFFIQRVKKIVRHVLKQKKIDQKTFNQIFFLSEHFELLNFEESYSQAYLRGCQYLPVNGKNTSIFLDLLNKPELFKKISKEEFNSLTSYFLHSGVKPERVAPLLLNLKKDSSNLFILLLKLPPGFLLNKRLCFDILFELAHSKDQLEQLVYYLWSHEQEESILAHRIGLLKTRITSWDQVFQNWLSADRSESHRLCMLHLLVFLPTVNVDDKLVTKKVIFSQLTGPENLIKELIPIMFETNELFSLLVSSLLTCKKILIEKKHNGKIQSNLTKLLYAVCTECLKRNKLSVSLLLIVEFLILYPYRSYLPASVPNKIDSDIFQHAHLTIQLINGFPSDYAKVIFKILLEQGSFDSLMFAQEVLGSKQDLWLEKQFGLESIYKSLFERLVDHSKDSSCTTENFLDAWSRMTKLLLSLFEKRGKDQFDIDRLKIFKLLTFYIKKMHWFFFQKDKIRFEYLATYFFHFIINSKIHLLFSGEKNLDRYVRIQDDYIDYLLKEKKGDYTKDFSEFLLTSLILQTEKKELVIPIGRLVSKWIDSLNYLDTIKGTREHLEEFLTKKRENVLSKDVRAVLCKSVFMLRNKEKKLSCAT